MDSFARQKDGEITLEKGVLSSYSAYYFIGIGGIGISAIARMLKAEGKTVTGSDRDQTHASVELEGIGVEVHYGQDEAHLPDNVECVIYTIAIPENNPDLVEARRRGIPCMTYPQALGELTRDKFTIAVSGTHGKTTTTAMIAKILLDAGLDPTVIVGSMLIDQKSNFIAGKSSLLVVEACEYRRSFLNLHPDIVVITNIDADHLDYYKDLDDIKSAFTEFVGKVPQEGYVVTNMCQEGMSDVLGATVAGVSDYSEFDCDIDLKNPGRHNYENAKAALAVADLLKIDEQQALKSLSEFSGTWRRFQHKGFYMVNETEVHVFDDYAHHPTEIRATLSGAKDRFQDVKKVVLFQPHLYSRTKLLFAEFAESFKDADKVFVLPIYAAREALDPNVSSIELAERITAAGTWAKPIEQGFEIDAITSAVEEYVGKGERVIVITIGASDVYKIAEQLVTHEAR